MSKKNHNSKRASKNRLMSTTFFISVIFLINASVVAGETYQFVSKWGSYGGGIYI